MIATCLFQIQYSLGHSKLNSENRVAEICAKNVMCDVIEGKIK